MPRRFIVQTCRDCVTAVALAGQELCFLWRMNSMNSRMSQVAGRGTRRLSQVAGRLETEMYSEASAHYLLGP